MIYIQTLNYYSEQNIIQLFKSLSNDDFFYKNCKYIIVDNSNTFKMSEEKKIPSYFKYEILKPKENLGFSNGHNYGFNKLSIKDEDIFVVANNDININDLHFFKNIFENVKKDELISPVIHSSKGIWFSASKFNSFGEIKQKKKLIGHSQFIPGCFLIMRASSFKKIGMFDSDFFMYCDDIDFSLKAQRLNFNLIVKNFSIFHDVGSGEDGNYSHVYLFHNTRNRLICSYTFFGLKGLLYFIIKYGIFRVIQLLIKLDFRGIIVSQSGLFSGLKKCIKS